MIAFSSGATRDSLVCTDNKIRILEVNADKTKYMVMSREQTAGLSHTMKVQIFGNDVNKPKFYSGRN